jgi:hypothetical protein
MAVTPTSRVPFSTQYRGKRLCDCPDKFLEWCSTKLRDTDLHEYAIAADEVIKDRAGDGKYRDLEAQADQILRRAGYDPRGM